MKFEMFGEVTHVTDNTVTRITLDTFLQDTKSYETNIQQTVLQEDDFMSERVEKDYA
jgi:hypothetical protein